MNLGLTLSCQFSNRGVFFLQPFPYRYRILFVRSSHRLLWGQTPGSQIASHRPHRNLQIEFSRQQLLHRFPGPQGKGQTQLVRATAENVAHRRGCLMRCQSRNRRPSSTSCFQCPTSYAFYQPHPAAHRTSCDPENPSRLGLRKSFLHGLNASPAKVFLGFPRQRASILFSHARHTNTLPIACHLYYALISKAQSGRNSKISVSISGSLYTRFMIDGANVTDNVTSSLSSYNLSQEVVQEFQVNTNNGDPSNGVGQAG